MYYEAALGIAFQKCRRKLSNNHFLDPQSNLLTQKVEFDLRLFLFCHSFKCVCPLKNSNLAGLKFSPKYSFICSVFDGFIL